MGKPSLCLIISLAIITIFLFSAHINHAQSVMYQPVANLSTKWINNNPTIFFNSSNAFLYHMTPVLSLSNTSQFISGFYCSPNETSCFFGIVVFGKRYDSDEYLLPFTTTINDPQLVWSANRDRPVGVNATLEFTGNGNLILEDTDGNIVWSTDTGRKSVTGLRFTEFGNLELFDRKNTTVWQSFDHPTDSLLLGQKLVAGQKLIASTSSSDFSRGLFSLSVQHSSLVGYLEANPQLVYYESTLIFSSPTNPKEEYVVFEEGSFNGKNFPNGSTAQFMRLEPNGHLTVYEWGGAVWMTVVDLLTSDVGYCGYPMACGKYGICSNEACGCNGTFSKHNEFGLGCSLITPISCHYSHYHSLLEIENTGYFAISKWLSNYQLAEKTGLEDCKNACLKNCSCKAALFIFPSDRSCFLISEVFSLISTDSTEGDSLIRPEREYSNYNDFSSVFIKVQNAPSSFHQEKSRSGAIILGSSLGAAFGLCLLVGSCIFIFKRKREKEKLEDELSFVEVPGMPTRFPYDDLKIATNDFNNMLGKGGFGSVFEGMLSDGTKIAVKRLDGLRKSFLAEVETIGSIHHVNLVRLIGFCSEKSVRLLVYEYMPNGSLDKWIFRQVLTLGWESRKKIILDVAKGLAYLHEDCRQKIYHLDIKPQNILLDDHFNAKISDFGLSKLIDKDQSQVVTTMRGTVGYLAPEWLSSTITEKVDVYSFGVVVLEILCGRKNLDRSQPEEDKHLLSLFKRKAEEELLLDLVDKHNDEMQLHGAEVVEMMRVALWCLQGDFTRRPLMSVVVKVLEGSVDVENNLDYSFTSPAVPRTIAAASHHNGGVTSSTPPFPSTLSGPR